MSTSTASLGDPTGGPSAQPAATEGPGTVPTWIMIARTGTWLGHPARPEVVTPEMLRSALDYFNRHYAAHGTDLVIDYHHASALVPLGAARAPAAGWVQRMELRADGTELWGRVQWTTEAASAIASRRYRYLSPVLAFNAPDRVTGEPVPMLVRSVALTNTPFLTELQSLNEAAATDGGGNHAPHTGGESMSLLDSLAGALNMQPEQVASRLGLEGAARDDASVAQAVLANAARLKDLEAGLAPRRLPDDVCNSLGVPPEADDTALRAALIRLKAPRATLAAVRRQLGLPEDADDGTLLNAIADLQHSQAESRAVQLVDGAIAEGRIPPAHRQFYLNEALADLEAARQVINSLPVIVSREPARRKAPPGPRRELTETELSVCRQLGLSQEAFLNASE